MLSLPTTENSYHEESLGAVARLVVETKSGSVLNIPLGSWCMWRGEKYVVYTAPEVVKQSTLEYSYTITLYSEAQRLSMTKFKFIIDTPRDVRLKFSLSGTPRFFLEQIIRCLGDGWSIGSCLEAPAQALSFSHEDCLAALSRVAEAFKTEWHISGRVLHLGKVNGRKEEALPLSYGKGNGLLPGLSVQQDGDHIPAGRVYVIGGARNIDPSSYGSRSLRMPKSSRLSYGGRVYLSDDKGEVLSVEGMSLDNRSETSYDGSSVYPHRVGRVSSVVRTAQGNYDVIDKDCDVDYSKLRIAGEKAVITFQSGRLAGRSFDIAQDEKALKYDHAAKRFQLVSVEEDGLRLPEPKTFYPAEGDTYAVFGIKLPDQYINKAERELMETAARYMHEQIEPRVTYRAELDGIYSSKNWTSIGGKLKLGAMVHLTDSTLGIDDYVRISSIHTPLSKERKPKLTLSNAIVLPSLASTIGRLEAEEVSRSNDVDRVGRETQRSMEQAIQHSTLVVAALSDRFTREISPVAVQTMQLLLGDQRTQLRFVSPSPWQPVWNKLRSVVVLPEGVIEHQTLGLPATISNAEPTRKRWTLSRLESPHLGEAGKPYYIYAQVPKSGDRGAYRIEEQHLPFETSTHYNLLLGTLSSADASGSRSFARLYGFTEVLPGQMRTERIASPDGTFVLDLVGKQIITPSLRFSSGGKTVQEIIREGDKTALEGAKNYAEGKAREAKGYAEEKAEEAKRWNIHEHTFDLTQLDPSKYYAAVIHLTGSKGIPYKQPAYFEIALYAGLDPSVPKPPYATHPHGFFIDLRWSVNASGYGGRKENRVITHYDKLSVLQGEEVVSAPKQLIALSAEYVYLRGGGRYLVSVKSDVAPAFALATERWTIKGYETHGIPSPVDSVTPPKSDTDRLRDEMREGDRATLEGAKNAAQRYFDSGKAEILRGLDATARGLVERITGADNRLTDAERKLGETQQQLAQSKEQLSGQLTASIAQLEARNAELQRQVDKQVQSFFGVNPPAGRIDWPASDDAKHEGDTYTCVPPDGVTITSANAAQYPNVGKSWRFTRGGWTPIADTDTTRALALAGQAKAAADGKVTHYRGSAVPTGYKEGDLWTLTADWSGYKKGTILTAVRDYVSGQYNPAHWREEVRYTDDSAVRNMQLGGRNYAKDTASVKEGSAYLLSEYRVGAPWVAGVDYTISFVLGSEAPDMVVYLYVDGWSASDTAIRAEGTPTQGADGLYYARYSATFRTTQERIDLSVKRIAGGNGGFRLYKQRRVGGNDQGRYVLSRVMLERGNKPSDWSLAPEDVDDKIESKAKEAKDHADTNLTKANTHTDNAVSALERKQVTTAEELKRISEAQAQDRERLNTTSDTAAKAKELAEAAKNGLGSLDYLARAIKDGETTVSGGVVLANILAAKELGTGAVRSFIAGEIYNERTKRLYPAFAAGVTGFGTANERRVVEINHDGTGHFGAMSVEQGGQIIRFYPTLGTGGQVLRIGGYQPSLDEIISRRPYSATLSHSGGFDRRNLAETLGAELWRSSETFYAPIGAHLIYRMSVRGLRCFISGGDPAVYPYIRPEEWDTDVELTFSVWRSGAPFDPVAEVTRYVGANASVGEREQSVEDVHLELDLPATDTYYAKVTATRKQLYHVTTSSKEQVDKVPSGMEVVLELTVQECTGTVSKSSDVEQETVISDKGITILKSARRFVAISPYDDDGKPVLSVRGKIDIPGVLLSAQIKINGSLFERVVSKWGTLANALRIDRLGVGRWRITHNLGHTDYSVHASAHSNGYGGIYVQEQRTHSFEVVTSDRSDPADGISFSLLVFGDPK